MFKARWLRALSTTSAVCVGLPRHLSSHRRFLLGNDRVSYTRFHYSNSRSMDNVKYCANCGRLISPNHRNFEERKYCSKTCSGTRLLQLDKEIQNMFMKRALTEGSVTTTAVQDAFEHTALENVSSQNAQEIGMLKAQFRERVRRAGRRVVVLPNEANHRFECVQDGKAVQPSFAKGEWSVRLANRSS